MVKRILQATSVLARLIPQAKLVCSNAGNETIEFDPAYLAGLGRILFYNRDTNSYTQGILKGSVLRFDIGENEALRIDSSGNVGIGTSDPQAKLDVDGLIQSSEGIKITGGTADDVGRGIYFSSAGLSAVSNSHGANVCGLSVAHVGNGSNSAIASSLRIVRGASNGSERPDYRGINIFDIKANTAGHTAYGIYSGLTTSSTANNYNFYATGTAPNYFRGSVYKDMNGGGELVVAADPETYTNHDSNGISLGYSLFCTRTSATPLDINRGKTGDTTLDDSTNHQVMMIRYKGAQKATIIVGTSGAELTGFTRVANPSMDGRVLTSPTEITNATDVIKQLAPKQEGFKAEELQAIVPEAVTGTQNATEAIGTLADYDGTVIETEITEPSAEELEYTEEVETDGVATMVTRTRTWTPSGTRPVYQGVDQTKLIPLLTKALQEALERIEVLEGLIAN